MRRARVGALPIIVLAVIALAAAAVPVPAQQLSRLTGVVKDDTGVPIKGAVVTAHNPETAPTTFTTTTDEKGRFAMLGLRRGVWTLTASAPGYESHEISGPIQPRQPLPVIEFELRRTPTPGPRGALASVDVSKLQEDLRAAEALAAAGKLDEALTVYQKTLAQVPALTAVHGAIGDVYLKKREPEKALAAYQQMLATTPTSEKAHAAVCDVSYALGMAALDRHDTPAASKYLEQSIAADPSSARAAEARAALERFRRSP